MCVAKYANPWGQVGEPVPIAEKRTVQDLFRTTCIYLVAAVVVLIRRGKGLGVDSRCGETLAAHAAHFFAENPGQHRAVTTRRRPDAFWTRLEPFQGGKSAAAAARLALGLFLTFVSGRITSMRLDLELCLPFGSLFNVTEVFCVESNSHLIAAFASVS